MIGKEYPNYVDLICSFLLSFSETHKPNNFHGEIKMQLFQRMKIFIQQNVLFYHFKSRDFWSLFTDIKIKQNLKKMFMKVLIFNTLKTELASLMFSDKQEN